MTAAKTGADAELVHPCHASLLTAPFEDPAGRTGTPRLPLSDGRRRLSAGVVPPVGGVNAASSRDVMEMPAGTTGSRRRR